MSIVEQVPNKWQAYMAKWDVYEAFHKLRSHSREWLEIVETLSSYQKGVILLPTDVSTNLKLLSPEFVVNPQNLTNSFTLICVVPSYTDGVLGDLSILDNAFSTSFPHLSTGGVWICKLPEVVDERELQTRVARYRKLFTSFSIYTPTVRSPYVRCRFFVGNSKLLSSLPPPTEKEVDLLLRSSLDEQEYQKKEKLQEFLSGPNHPLAKRFVDNSSLFWYTYLAKHK